MTPPDTGTQVATTLWCAVNLYKVRLSAVPVSQLSHPQSTQQVANSLLQKTNPRIARTGCQQVPFILQSPSHNHFCECTVSMKPFVFSQSSTRPHPPPHSLISVPLMHTASLMALNLFPPDPQLGLKNLKSEGVGGVDPNSASTGTSKCEPDWTPHVARLIATGGERFPAAQLPGLTYPGKLPYATLELPVRWLPPSCIAVWCDQLTSFKAYRLTINTKPWQFHPNSSQVAPMPAISDKSAIWSCC